MKIVTVPEGSATQTPNPTNEEIYKLAVNVNQVILPVRVTDESGRVVNGLLPKDFSVYEDGKKQSLNFFTSDPFALAAAIILDVGMPDVAVQKVNKTFAALEGSFGQYDEVSVYTYSNTVGRSMDFSAANQKLAGTFNDLSNVTGRNNTPPITGGPLGPGGPYYNGYPVDPQTPAVITPPTESHVLNDAILAAAQDLSKRDKVRRRIIFVISNGREYKSKASYQDVLKVLLTNGITVYAIGVDTAAMPIYNKVGKLHLPGMGYTNILPKYASATAGEVFNEYSRQDIENVYSRALTEARNQYALGYVTRATYSEAYRQIEVRVDRPGCNSDLRPCVNVYARDGYYPLPAAR
jgi:VWFA-related protein